MTVTLQRHYENCHLCGHHCGKNRLAGEVGTCGLSAEVLVSSTGPHYGEEPELVGRFGSGTIFFAGCNLSCRFCQNWEISHLRQGDPATVAELASMMLGLGRMGCHNINFVTPTPYTPSILEALKTARERGLTVPAVYNSGGYESPEVLALCEGLIEIYMPDAKYSDADLGLAFSGADNYPDVNQAALKEMHRQVGDLEVVAGVARRGLLVRHLVLPNYPANSRGVLEFIAQDISPQTYLNIMDQYRPCYQAEQLPGMDRRLSAREYAKVLRLARQTGLSRGLAA